MLTIIRCNKDLIEDGILARAKENLRKFPTLHSIFENFDEPRFSNYQNKNIVFVKSMMSNEDSLNFLLRIENALYNLVSHGKLLINRPGELNKKFLNRITSSVPSEFLPVISEVLVADYLLSLFGQNNFHYEEGTKAETKPDFEITANSRKYSLELRTLMKGTTSEKIEAIFDQLCMHILNLLKRKTRGCNLVARLDTLNLCIIKTNK